MEIQKINTQKLLRTCNDLYIPFYQRKYVWSENDVKQLLEDVNENGNHEYYLGSIFLLYEGPKWKIIDGQQRLTTLWLITKALKLFFSDYLQNYNLTEISNNLTYFKFNSSHLDDGNNFKRIMECNNKDLLLVLDEKNSQFEKSQFYINLICIKKYLEMYIGRLDSFFEKLNNVIFSQINVDLNVDENILFSKINSTGKKLSAFDLTKNFLFSKILFDLDKCNKNETINEKILLFSNIVESNISENEGDELIRHFISFKTGKLCNSNSKSIYDFFVKLYENNKNSALLFEELLNFSVIYFFIKNNFKKENYKFNKILFFLSHSFKTYVVLMVHIFYNNSKIEKSKLILNKDDIDNIYDILLILEAYKVRREFFDFSEKTITRFIPKLIFDIDIYLKNIDFNNIKYCYILYYLLFVKSNDSSKNKNLPMYRGPTIEGFKSNFISKNIYNYPKFCKLFLIRLSSNSSKGEIDFKSFSIEHVLPQDYSKWKKDGYDEDPNLIIEKINTIGNLTLTAYNQEYSNDLFLNKVAKMKEKENFSLNNYFYDLNEWNLFEIQKRANNLFDKTLEIWNLTNFENYVNNIKDKLDFINLPIKQLLDNNYEESILKNISHFRRIKQDLTLENIKKIIEEYVVMNKSLIPIEFDVFKMNFDGWVSKSILDFLKINKKNNIDNVDINNFNDYIKNYDQNIKDLLIFLNDIL